MRILITGASGAGSTTLGRALALHLGACFLDSDDYFWLPTEPPYTTRRDPAERNARLLADGRAQPHVVVAGSVMAWGEAVETSFDLIVFLYVATAIRMARLEAREIARFGKAKPEFMDWAAGYDTGPEEGRSLRTHLAWLASRQAAVLRLEGDLALETSLQQVLAALPRGPG